MGAAVGVQSKFSMINDHCNSFPTLNNAPIWCSYNRSDEETDLIELDKSVFKDFLRILKENPRDSQGILKRFFRVF